MWHSDNKFIIDVKFWIGVSICNLSGATPIEDGHYKLFSVSHSKGEEVEVRVSPASSGD